MWTSRQCPDGRPFDADIKIHASCVLRKLTRNDRDVSIQKV